jgi:hypothetical protein
MSTNFHSPIVAGESNSPNTLNTRYSGLDSAIVSAFDAINALTIEGGTSDAEVIAARSAINYLAGSPPATLAAALALVAGDIFNVLAYGAVADGTTDDAAAIQEAIDAANAAGGGRVWIPKQGSKYKIDTPVELLSNVHLMSDGAILDTDGATGFDVDHPGALFGRAVSNVRVEGLRIEGNGQATMVSFEHGLGVWVCNNDIEMDAPASPVNTAAIRICAAPAGNNNDFGDTWVVNNRLRPSSLGILCQGRLSSDPYFRHVYVLGNTLDYASATSASIGADTPAAIKMDLNLDQFVVANNVLFGNGFVKDGIHVQEDIHDGIVIGNTVRAFARVGITVEGGQTAAVVQNVNVTGNVVSNMVGATSIAINVQNNSASNWKNISVTNNIVSDCEGIGIKELGEGDRVANVVIADNIVSECAGIGITVRSHGAVIRNNRVNTSASVTGIELVSSSLNSSILGNHLTTAAASPISDSGSGTLRRNNVANGVWDATNESIIDRWAAGDYRMAEGIVTGLSLPVTVQTSFTLTTIANLAGPARGAYSCTGEIIAGSSSSSVFHATFAASFRMTDASTVDERIGTWIYRSNATVFSAVDLHTDLTNIILRVTNGSGSVSLDNMMIRFRVMKTDDI